MFIKILLFSIIYLIVGCFTALWVKIFDVLEKGKIKPAPFSSKLFAVLSWPFVLLYLIFIEP